MNIQSLEIGKDNSRFWFVLFELLARIHGHASRTATESVAFRSVLSAVAVFAVQLSLVFGAVGGVQELAAHS